MKDFVASGSDVVSVIGDKPIFVVPKSRDDGNFFAAAQPRSFHYDSDAANATSFQQTTTAYSGIISVGYNNTPSTVEFSDQCKSLKLSHAPPIMNWSLLFTYKPRKVNVYIYLPLVATTLRRGPGGVSFTASKALPNISLSSLT